MPAIIFMNDTGKDVEVRLNISGTLPSGFEVKNGKMKLLNLKTDKVFIKLWSNNTILFQDQGDFSLDNLKIREKGQELEQQKLASNKTNEMKKP